MNQLVVAVELCVSAVWQRAKNKSYDGVQLFHKLQDDLYDTPGNNSSEIEALCSKIYSAANGRQYNVCSTLKKLNTKPRRLKNFKFKTRT
jgi:hypothetical protein